MRKLVYAAWIAALAAAVFFFYALEVYLHGGRPPTPGRPQKTSVPSIPALVAKSPTGAPSSRYAPLTTGELFFPSRGEEKETAPLEETPSTYVSALALRGIVLAEGRPPMAVLTRANAPATGESWTVRVGETIMGETVVAIERERVILRKEGKETVLVLPDR
ncbi:MAG: hypothetical protein GX493_12735 [Firmicutes bacterium]|nr:hypothetical protein [Bacillota bacterium]